MKVRMVPLWRWSCNECNRSVKRDSVKGDDTGRAFGSCSHCGHVRVRRVQNGEYPQLVKDGEK